MNQRTSQLSKADVESLKAADAATQEIEQENQPKRVNYDRNLRMFEFTAKFLLPPPTKNYQDRQ